jgi:hypothetical protein
MATAAEHFQESVEIVARLASNTTSADDRDFLVRLAQVHATLANHPQVEATNGLAGEPGYFEPYNATLPYSLAAVRDQVTTPHPATAWAEGEYVVLGDGTHAYWDGNSWEAGEAPA